MANNNNTITIKGNLCADCEIYKDKLVKCRVAVNRGGRNAGIPPLYLNVSLFTDNEDVLDSAFINLVKGTRVEATGELSVNTYEGADGLEHTDVGIIASEINKIGATYLPIRNKPADNSEDKPARSRKPADNSEDKPARSRKPHLQNFDDGEAPF